MNRSRSWRPFGIGLALMALIVSAVVYSTSAFAYTSDTTLWTPSTATLGIKNGSNVNGTFSTASVKVGSPLTYVASFSVLGNAGSVSLGSTAAGIAPSAATTQAIASTPVRALYQQYWRRASNDFFWIYAVNNVQTASIGGSVGTLGSPAWHVYNYVPGKGATLMAASQGNGVAALSAATGSLVASSVYLGSGTTRPALGIDSVSVSASQYGSAAAGAGGANGTASLTVVSRWGVAQEGFQAGTLSLRQAGETYLWPVETTTTTVFGTTTTRTNLGYYDAVASADTSSTGGASITLTSTAPAQTAANVVNGTGTKFAQSAYTVTQVSTDADGDLNSQQLIFVNSAGDWFRIGTYQSRGNTSGLSNGVTVWAFYDSSMESPMYSSAAVAVAGTSSALSGRYLINSTVGLTAVTSADREAGQVGVTSQSLSYTLTFSPLARGSWTTYARAEDWHGSSSGGVYGTSVGALTIG